MVEQWFPKPKVKGSNPFFPEFIFFFKFLNILLVLIKFLIFFIIFEKSLNNKIPIKTITISWCMLIFLIKSKTRKFNSLGL